MADSVINGAVGKSPVIDKINRLPDREVKSRAAIRSEQWVCGDGTVKYPPVSVSFHKCREEVKERIERRMAEKEEGNGAV